MKRRVDRTGCRFGRLLVLGPAPDAVGQTRAYAAWRCRCDCGTEVVRLGQSMRSGSTQSCGCLGREVAARVLSGPRRKKHGESMRDRRSREWQAWMGMRMRCENAGGKDWGRYGGRGITVCERWRESFESFLTDVGRCPSSEHSLDRVDNGRGYEPGNVRWATRSEQARNRRSNHVVEFRGERLALVAWAQRVGIGASVLSERIRRGWSVERALTTPKLYSRDTRAKGDAT